MIVRIDDEQKKRQERRKLIADTVYVICQDKLKELQKEGRTGLAPVEVFLSAQNYTNIILLLPDISEGIDDELDDLEDDASSKDEAVIIMMVIAAQMEALSRHHIGADYKGTILRIFSRIQDHELFFPLLDGFANKEQARWLEGKKTNLLNYELNEIADGEGRTEEVMAVFESMLMYSEHMDKNSIKEQIIFLCRYNLDHGNAYNKILLDLFEKLGIKSTTLLDVKEYVAMKCVENEIQHVEAGGTGVSKTIQTK